MIVNVRTRYGFHKISKYFGSGDATLTPPCHFCTTYPYMSAFDDSKPSSFIAYLDANNLYGWAMSKNLPTHGFEWMGADELNDWRSTSSILEVDLEYPKELHDLHNDYPL